MQDTKLNDAIAKLITYQAFLEKKVKGMPKHLMTKVHEHYFKPEYEDYKDKNLWSLSNAFTSAFKELNPLKQFEVTARLGTFFTDLQNELKEATTLDFQVEKKEKVSIPNSNQIATGRDHGFEDFDKDDAPREWQEDFDEDFDSEEADKHLEELIERLDREDEKDSVMKTAT